MENSIQSQSIQRSCYDSMRKHFFRLFQYDSAPSTGSPDGLMRMKMTYRKPYAMAFTLTRSEHKQKPVGDFVVMSQTAVSTTIIQTPIEKTFFWQNDVHPSRTALKVSRRCTEAALVAHSLLCFNSFFFYCIMLITLHHGRDTCSNRGYHLAESVRTIKLKCFTSVDGAAVLLFCRSPLHRSSYAMI